MGETIVLDPPVLAGTRSDLDITGFVGRDGPSWGDATIAATMADAIIGARPVDYTIPNRIVTIPLNLLDHDGLTFETLRMQVQQLVGLWQDQGGWLQRTVAGEPIYLDVIDARLHLGGSSAQAMFGLDADAVLELETLPDWYGDEITLDTLTAINGEIVSTLALARATATIAGNFPRGNRCRIKVTDTSGANQKGIIAAFRRRNYSPDATAALSYEAEALSFLDITTYAGLTGASGTARRNAFVNSALSVAWTSIFNTNILFGPTFLTHRGTYRVRARVYSTSPAGTVQARFLWDVGDLINPSVNDPFTIPDTSKFYIADLGEIRLDPTPVGTHRWIGQFQAKGTIGGENVYVDRIWFVPIDEYAVALTPSSNATPIGSGFFSHDEFNQTAGALGGKSTANGQLWVTSGSGADFTVDATNHCASRNTTLDTATGLAFGHLDFTTSGGLGTTDQAAQVDVKVTGVTGAETPWLGLALRRFDLNNFLIVALAASPTGTTLMVRQRVAGVETTIAAEAISVSPYNAYRRLSAVAFADGTLAVTVGTGDFVNITRTYNIAALATGGGLASGSVGIFDWHFGSSAAIRAYDNFAGWTPAVDAVLFARTTAELRTEGHYRQDATGTAYGPIENPIGNLPRLPSSGEENVPVELFLKVSRGDLDALPDSALDGFTAQVLYRPCWLFTPDPA